MNFGYSPSRPIVTKLCELFRSIRRQIVGVEPNLSHLSTNSINGLSITPLDAGAEKEDIVITFKSIGHFFATAYQKVVAVLPKIENSEATVEKVTAAVPVYGTLALPIEKLGYACLGELSAVLNAGGAAATAKLTDAGLDINVIQSVQALIASVPQIADLAKNL